MSQDGNHSEPLDGENFGQQSDVHLASYSDVLKVNMRCFIFADVRKLKHRHDFQRKIPADLLRTV